MTTKKPHSLHMRDYLAHEDRRKELEEGVEAKGKGPLKTRKGHVETSGPLGIKQPPSAAVRTNRVQGFSHQVFSLHRINLSSCCC